MAKHLILRLKLSYRRWSRQGDQFRRIVEPQKDDIIYPLVTFLDNFDIRTAYPLLLHLLEEGLSDADWEEISIALESYLLRRAVCGLTTKNYNRVFLGLTRTLRKDGTSADRIYQALSDFGGDSNEWPRDEAFRASWNTGGAYQVLQSGRLVHLFRRLNEKYLNTKSEAISIDSPLTVEHLMPQGWIENWPLPNGALGLTYAQLEDAAPDDAAAIATRRRNSLIHSIGNMTIVSQALNSSVSNSDWATKKPEILKSSLLPINLQLVDKEKWNEATIVDRSADLFKFALGIWPRAETIFVREGINKLRPHMQIQFDPNQEYQRDAVNAVLDLFDGQSKSEAHFSVVREFSLGTQLSGLVRTERALGNQLTLTEPKLRQNCHAIQERNDIESTNSGTPLEGWELPSLGTAGDVNFLPPRPCLHFSVEMETGTGKTYVYLRTIYELAERYGWLKFIIVVPSVAIREGVKENLRITAEHFRSLYHQTARVQVYEGRRVQELKEFAQSNTLQVLVINIDAFNKNFGPDADRKNNVIFKEQEGFENSTPIETVQASQPIVILDEPQSIDNTERAQEAIKALRPLFTLRYSATHKNPYNVVYRLGPIEAFEQRLVKQIVVDSAEVEGAGTSAFIHVKSIDSKSGFKAKLQIHAQGKEGPKPKLITVKDRSNLFHESNERAAYKDGFVVREISVRPGGEFIEFVNGIRLGIGQEHGGVRDDVQGAQIRRTVKHHLEKELAVQNLGVKVLSLFFIDRVANYREYEADGPKPGRFAAVVEDALREFAKDSRYASLEWLKLPADKLHDGYFAKDKKSGAIKDASGSTADDSTAYELIMQKKEELLSLATPLRFIFSHSALREGWDNPNVFQICTLNERQSTMTKRQEIGRGLRLPVNQQGIRVRDDSVNRLYVVANESYDEFARGLQANYAEDGVHFGRVSKRAFARLMQGEGDEAKPMGMASSQALWETLQNQGILSEQGDLRPGVAVYDPKFQLKLPQEFAAVSDAVIDMLRSHRIERHVQNDKDIKRNPRRQEQIESPEFKELWNRISARTRYRVEFETDELVRKAVEAMKRIPEIRPVEVRFTTAATTLRKAGVAATPESQSHQELRYKGPLPDLLAYLQAQTDLTRSTLQRVLKTSGRLEEFLINPQEFMDATVGALRTAMLELLIDGIQYERIPETEPDHVWQQEQIFEAFTNVDILAAVKVKNSIYEWVPVDSKVEQVFAEGLDQRHLTFKLFLKLPRSFTVRTPVGEYQPDWAIVKQDGEMLYLIRETKGSRNYQKLRTSEAYKVRCGHKHFGALDVSFDVVEKVEQV